MKLLAFFLLLVTACKIGGGDPIITTDAGTDAADASDAQSDVTAD